MNALYTSHSERLKHYGSFITFGTPVSGEWGVFLDQPSIRYSGSDDGPVNRPPPVVSDPAVVNKTFILKAANRTGTLSNLSKRTVVVPEKNKELGKK
jgi:hypothetical protein